ncbi:MAG: ABC transporter substrate-binding protein [Nitrospinaceae bacterium]|jgi:aliphatic sulfonates family ABC transporter substrate-binding protein|nr:ABC transporter substrate-binding protein [Nitrospinaceae bacterium]MBT3432473.1 ABC transporter substrate-binding protein [Nitrospinaceae bacterium]MBT3821327.1 ABC transporter substrate-binding protein [Nitrospinaceae bacterium]MBT4095417.1 ABC transporter substrate-binding protein [Nitrospinaceae bacterium]MBT4431201.1 ABC transporter substrate-binding protein [Nitrospinaceae bacterium]
MFKRNRKWLLFGIIAIVAAGLALPSGADAARKKRKKTIPLRAERDVVKTVKFAYSESATAIVPIVALQKGFLKAEGLNATGKPLKSGAMALSSVYGGSLDFGTTSNGRLVQWASKGWNMKTVAVNNTGFLAVVLVKNGDTTSKTMADLKGKKIAIQKGSGTHIAWLRYLDKIGLSEKMFEMRYMRTSRIGAAMGTGTIDAAVPWYPFAKSILNRKLGRQIIDKSEIETVAKVPYPFMLYTRSGFIKKHPGITQKVVNAWVKSKRWIENNREEAAKLFHKFSTRRGKKLKMEDARFFIKILDFKTDVWNEEMMADLKANQVLLKKLGKIKTTPNLYDYVDNSFVKKAGSM